MYKIGLMTPNYIYKFDSEINSQALELLSVVADLNLTSRFDAQN